MPGVSALSRSLPLRTSADSTLCSAREHLCSPAGRCCRHFVHQYLAGSGHDLLALSSLPTITHLPCSLRYETYQLLARIITFGERIAELLTTVQSRLGEASHPKTRNKLAQLLQHAARGVLANPTGACLDGWQFGRGAGSAARPAST